MFWRYNEIDFDQTGFWPPSLPSNRLSWHDITRVALCYEIHPIALSDWDYWAFQTNDPMLFVWIEINQQTTSKGFTKQVHEKFGSPDIPPMKCWVDSEACIRTYVIWPQEEIGRALYVAKKKHWWSQRAELDYCSLTQEIK